MKTIAPFERILAVLSLVLAGTWHASGQGIEHRAFSSQRVVSPVTASSAHIFLVTTASAPSPIREFGEYDVNHDHQKFLLSSLLHETKTPFMTQSRLPVAEAFRSRLQMNFVMASINRKNVVMGPLAPSQSTQAFVQARSQDSYGFSFNVPLGRDPGPNGSQGVWRGVARVLRRR
jgi:hypothetical protein